MGIILAARKVYCKNMTNSKAGLEQSVKCIFSATKAHKQKQNIELIAKSPENGETVKETLIVRHKLSQSSGTQTVDDEFLVPYRCPIHEAYECKTVG